MGGLPLALDQAGAYLGHGVVCQPICNSSTPNGPPCSGREGADGLITRRRFLPRSLWPLPQRPETVQLSGISCRSARSYSQMLFPKNCFARALSISGDGFRSPVATHWSGIRWLLPRAPIRWCPGNQRSRRSHCIGWCRPSSWKPWQRQSGNSGSHELSGRSTRCFPKSCLRQNMPPGSRENDCCHMCGSVCSELMLLTKPWSLPP
jgi:hypothetical protein